MASLNITNIPAPRVPFIDERTGLMAREWYRFFLNLFVLTGSGNNPITLEELQLGPPSQPDLAELLIQINQNIAPQYEDQSGDFLATLDTAQLMSMMSRFENAEAAIQGAYLQPPQLPVDGVYVVGPGSSTDNAVARFDGTTGKLIQNSVTTIDDTGAATGFTTFAASTSVTTPTVQASNSAGLSLKNASGTTQINMGAGGVDNVSVNVSTNLNGTNAQIDISPTGTGHVHVKPSGTGSIEIAPTNVGTIDNMTIGATAPKNGSFVDLSVTGTTSFDGAQGTAGQVLTSAGTGATPTWTTPTTGTVTSVAALTLGTTGTDLSSTVANGTTTPVITLQVPTASATNRGALSAADWTTFNNKGSGTVTSVAQSFTGGLISVAGSPITSSGTLALTVAGTSGGVPYFSSATTWATSAALAAGSLVQGGGAGVAPSTITTGTGVVTALGVNTGTAGAFVVNGGALGSPSSAGTIPAFTLGGTVSGGGNQLNNVIIGTTTPLAGAFTTLSATGTITPSIDIQFGAGGTSFYNNQILRHTNNILYIQGGTSGIQLNRDSSRLDTIDIGSTANQIDVQTNGVTRTRTTNSGLAVTGLMSATTGQFTGTSLPASGAGIEIFYSGGSGWIQGYNRTGSAYIGNIYDALNHQWNISGSSKMTLDASGILSNTAAIISGTYIKASSYLWAAGAGGAGGVYLGAAGSYNGLISQASSGSGTTNTYIGNALITAVSDSRLKENVVDTTRNAIEILEQLRVVDHTWNDPSDQCENNRNSRGVWMGLIAQEAQPIIPWLVNKPTKDVDEDGNPQYWHMDYGYSVPLLIKAIQELSAKVAALEAIQIKEQL